VLGSLHNTIDFDEPAEVISSEYGVRFRVQRMAFVIGMRDWQYDREYDSGSRSDIELDFSGPIFRLSFGF
jgi:hypothetical protein